MKTETKLARLRAFLAGRFEAKVRPLLIVQLLIVALIISTSSIVQQSQSPPTLPENLFESAQMKILKASTYSTNSVPMARRGGPARGTSNNFTVRFCKGKTHLGGDLLTYPIAGENIVCGQCLKDQSNQCLCDHKRKKYGARCKEDKCILDGDISDPNHPDGWYCKDDFDIVPLRP